MNIIIKGASGFMGLFDTGAETFVSWVSGIVPKVLLLLILMNTIIALIGQERVNKFAKLCSGNPMALSMGKFLPERMKPSYYASASYHCHTNSGIFSHINPGEIFIYLGIAQGVQKAGFDMTELGLRYMLVGLVMNFFSGWVTDFTTKMVMKQQGIELSNELK